MSEVKENTNLPEEAAELSQEEVNEYKRIRMDKLAALQAEGADPFEITKFDVTASCTEAKAGFEAVETECKAEAGEDAEKLAELLEARRDECRVSIAGRVMSKRMMGKASFMDMRDKTDKLQLYVRMNEVGKESFDRYVKKGDIGDIVGVSGFVFRTRMGEISLHAESFTLLSKNLLPLPEKWHG
ncbi:MAG: lysine--tRNA ligase, partial [Ruminococcus sp.]|nr:lysine--tRNA ligase [Ruminococcus sp.]